MDKLRNASCLGVPSLLLMLLVCTIASFVSIGCSAGFIGYDCGSNTQNMSTISLLHVENCNYQPDKFDITSQAITLLQLNQFAHTHTIQCKVSIKRHAYYCGWQSYASMVRNAHASFVMEISHSQCVAAHETSQITIANTVIAGLKPNGTTTRNIFFTGNADEKGNCQTGAYSDVFGTYENVVVQAEIEITLMSQNSKIDLETNEIIINTGTICTFSAGTCMDYVGGNTFWNREPEAKGCAGKQYSSLFNGVARKIISDSETFFTVELNDISFTLGVIGSTNFCGLLLARTEHPKLFILETTTANGYINEMLQRLQVENMDLMNYINAKFIYVERHIRGELKSLYKSFMLSRCEMERQILQNSLALATTMPDEFALRVMKSPGYMAVTAGEVIHLIKCIPTDVVIHRTSKCYDNLMVESGNKTFFLTPRTHILLTRAVEIPCNPQLSQFYQLHGLWYKMLPEAVHVPPPNTLQSSPTLEWNYKNPANLATSGIYSPEDTKKMKNMIMSRMEQRPALEAISHRIISSDSPDHKGTLYDVLDAESLEKLAQSTWDRTWGRFVKFGTYSAGIIGIFMIIRFVKVLMDIVIHGYSLHSIFGWSFKLIGALFSSVTHLLMHRHHEKTMKRISEDDETEDPTVLQVEQQSAPTADTPEQYATLYPKLHVNNDEKESENQPDPTSMTKNQRKKFNKGNK